jgi:hypothetical protein
MAKKPTFRGPSPSSSSGYVWLIPLLPNVPWNNWCRLPPCHHTVSALRINRLRRISAAVDMDRFCSKDWLRSPAIHTRAGETENTAKRFWVREHARMWSSPSSCSRKFVSFLRSFRVRHRCCYVLHCIITLPGLLVITSARDTAARCLCCKCASLFCFQGRVQSL